MSEIRIINNAISRLYEDTKEIFENKEITSSNILTFVVSLMQIVENYDDLSGIGKKEVVIEFLNKIVEEKINDEKDLDNTKFLISTTVPVFIDTIISVDKKELKIKTEKFIKKICKCFN